MPSNIEFARQAPGAEGYRFDHPAAAHLPILDAADGRVDLLTDRKRIAICGFASSSRHRMPITDPTAVIWGLNQLYRHIPRADCWFDIHANWAEDNVEGTDHPAWIRDCGIPVFMVNRLADAPTTVRYPIERMIQKFGVDYFTSTVSYMIALAIDTIDQKVEEESRQYVASGGTLADAQVALARIYGEYEIGIYGIDLIVGSEYDFQKACVEFWIGVASARGIRCYIPPESALIKQRWRYGYQQAPVNALISAKDLATRQAELRGRIQKVQETYQKCIAEMQTLDGALQESAHLGQVMELRERGGEIPLTSIG